MAIVYQHRRKDTNEIFYIGIGKDTVRAYAKEGRNGRWKDIVSRYDYNVEILIEDIDRKQAESWENYLIGIYGRENIGTGKLVNRTVGGEKDSSRVEAEREMLLNELRRVLPKDFKIPPEYMLDGMMAGTRRSFDAYLDVIKRMELIVKEHEPKE